MCFFVWPLARRLRYTAQILILVIFESSISRCLNVFSGFVYSTTILFDKSREKTGMKNLAI